MVIPHWIFLYYRAVFWARIYTATWKWLVIYFDMVRCRNNADTLLGYYFLVPIKYSQGSRICVNDKILLELLGTASPLLSSANTFPHHIKYLISYWIRPPLTLSKNLPTWHCYSTILGRWYHSGMSSNANFPYDVISYDFRKIKQIRKVRWPVLVF